MKESKKRILLYIIIGILLLAVILLSVLLFLSNRSSNSSDIAGTSTDSISSAVNDSTKDSDAVSGSGSSEDASSDSIGESSPESAEETTDETEITSENENLVYAEIIVRGTWESDGKPCASESVVICNNSDQAISDWTLCLTFSSAPVILELWNGRYTIDGNSIIITSESYNAEISAGGANTTADSTDSENSASADPLDQFSNIIYSVHFYAGTHREDLRSKVQAAMEAGLTIIISAIL